MNRRILRNTNFTKALYFAEPLQRKEMIESISQDDICAVSDISKNILEGRLVINYVHRQKLKQYKRTIRFSASPRINTNRKKQTMLVFHNVIPLLIKPVLHLLDEL